MGVKVWLALAMEALIFSALLFGGAGTLVWAAAWAYLIIFFGGGLWITLLLARHDPALLAKRIKSLLQKGQPLWDKVLILPMIVAWCGWLILMGLDSVRFRWSVMPVWLQCAGGALMGLSFRMIARVFLENPFLAAVVKIQTERGQRVISTGPYAVVRHPLYAAMLIYLRRMRWCLAPGTAWRPRLFFWAASFSGRLWRIENYCAVLRVRCAGSIPADPVGLVSGALFLARLFWLGASLDVLPGTIEGHAVIGP